MEIKIELLEPNKGQIAGVPKNPRKQSKAKLEALKRSIIELPEMLELRELLVYKSGERYVIIGGNMRYKALLALGYKSAPCKVLPSETPADKIKKIVLQDNNSFGEDDWQAMLAGWNTEELNALSYDIPDFLKESLETPTEGEANSEDDTKKVKKRKAWHGGNQNEVARCDLKPRYGIIYRAPYYIAHSFSRSEDGAELTDIKVPGNVSIFAASACCMLRGLLGMGSPENFALVTAPARRHKDWNFAQSIAREISRVLGVRFYPNALVGHGANRLKPNFELKENIAEDNVIIYDDILTTGSTIREMAKFFPHKNVTLVVGINNN